MLESDKDPILTEFMEISNLEKLVNEQFKVSKLMAEFEKLSNMSGMTTEQLYNANLDSPSYLGRYIAKQYQLSARMAELKNEIENLESDIKDAYRRKIERQKIYDKNEMLEMIAKDPKYRELINKLKSLEPLVTYIDNAVKYFREQRNWNIRNAIELMKLTSRSYND